MVSVAVGVDEDDSVEVATARGETGLACADPEVDRVMSECAGKLARASEGAVHGGAVVAQGVSSLDYWRDHHDEVAFALVAIGQPMEACGVGPEAALDFRLDMGQCAVRRGGGSNSRLREVPEGVEGSRASGVG